MSEEQDKKPEVGSMESEAEKNQQHFPEDSHTPKAATENIPEEKTEPSEPITHNSSLITTNMETHAHHLHHAPGKKIWHYFYEFLMLFLAVFSGFLAENWREHYVEHER